MRLPKDPENWAAMRALEEIRQIWKPWRKLVLRRCGADPRYA
jgi:hypothetical protein